MKTTGSVRWALASLSLCMLLPSLGISIANVALPILAKTFGAPFQQIQWVVIAYLLGVTALIVSVGRLGDIVGHRRMLLVGIALFAAASALCAIAPAPGLLIAARAVQGLGAAIMMALTVAFVGAIVPKERTGSAMGLLGTMSAIGTALGPSLGGMLIAGFGWPAIFLVTFLSGIAALLLAYRCLPTDRSKEKTDRTVFDYPGTLLLAATLAAYALAMTLGGRNFGFVNLVLLAATALGVGAFVALETRMPSPLVRLTILRDPILSAGLVMSALVSTVLMATLVVGPFYLSQSLGLSTASVGLVMSAGPLVAALTALPAGRITDRFGPARMTVLGLSGIAAGSLLLAAMPRDFGIAGYVASLALLTASYALFQTANNTAVMTDVPADKRGVVSGLLNLSRNLGLVTGASVMGAVFALASGTADIAAAQPEAVASGMRVTFVVAAVLIAVALALACGARFLAPRVNLAVPDRPAV